MDGPKFPNVKVKLVDRDGNAFAILGACIKAARNGGVPQADIDAFRAEAMSGNYDNLLQATMRWFDVH
jgi:hypothetical protein